MITCLKAEEQHQHKNGGGWKAKYKTIGKAAGYTAAQIKEYGLLIALVIKLGK